MQYSEIIQLDMMHMFFLNRMVVERIAKKIKYDKV